MKSKRNSGLLNLSNKVKKEFRLQIYVKDVYLLSCMQWCAPIIPVLGS